MNQEFVESKAIREEGVLGEEKDNWGQALCKGVTLTQNMVHWRWLGAV